jgi:hypothetical protein
MKLPECWLKCVDHRDDYVESNCMKLQTNFNKSVQCCFSEISIYIKGKLGGIIFQHAFNVHATVCLYVWAHMCMCA